MCMCVCAEEQMTKNVFVIVFRVYTAASALARAQTPRAAAREG